MSTCYQVTVHLSQILLNDLKVIFSNFVNMVGSSYYLQDSSNIIDGK